MLFDQWGLVRKFWVNILSMTVACTSTAGYRGLGGAQRVIGAAAVAPTSTIFVGKHPSGELATEDIADGNMRKSFRGTQVVNEQLPMLVGGDKPVAHLYPFTLPRPTCTVSGGFFQVPGTQTARGGKSSSPPCMISGIKRATSS